MALSGGRQAKWRRVGWRLAKDAERCGAQRGTPSEVAPAVAPSGRRSAGWRPAGDTKRCGAEQGAPSAGTYREALTMALSG